MDLYTGEGLMSETERKIRERLKKSMGDMAYSEWMENSVFEKLDSNGIVICYCGENSLKEFNRDYKESVWIQICSVLGYVKSFKIYKKKAKEQVKPVQLTEVDEPKEDVAVEEYRPKANKNIRVAKLFIISIIFVSIALAVAVITGSYISNRNFKESFFCTSTIKVNEKIRVIQISDLHSSKYGKNNQKLISRVKKLQPDIIVFTGDCIDSRAGSVEDTVFLAGEVAKFAPTYYIYGNNEVDKYYGMPLTQDELDAKYGFDNTTRNPAVLTEKPDELEKALEEKGVKVLKNERDSITIGTTKIDVYGVLTSNPSSFWSYSGGNFEEYINTDKNNVKITLMHEPLVYEEFSADTWGDLLICGHTHGGTLNVPLIGPLYTHEGGLFPERNGCYVYGRYDVSGSPLIVSSGLENNNLLRINNPPEIAIIDVNKF